MARLILILMMFALCVAIAAILYALWTTLVTAGQKGLRPIMGDNGDEEMAPTGIQKAAYIALIVILFGVASGWLGGL